MVGVSKESVYAIAVLMDASIKSTRGNGVNLQHKRATVMGLGRFGGGLGVTQWLLDQGADVLLTDLAPEKELESQLSTLGSHPNLQIICGEHRVQDFSDTDLVVANPAIPQPWSNKFLLAAWESGDTVTSEIQLVTQQLHREHWCYGNCG